MRFKRFLIFVFFFQFLNIHSQDSIRIELLKSIDTLISLYSNLPLGKMNVDGKERLFETLLEFDEQSNQFIFREYYYFNAGTQEEVINVYAIHLEDIDMDYTRIEALDKKTISFNFASKKNFKHYYEHYRKKKGTKGYIQSFEGFYIGYYKANWLEYLKKIASLFQKILFLYEAGDFKRNTEFEKAVFGKIIAEEEFVPIVYYAPRKWKKEAPHEVKDWNNISNVPLYRNTNSKKEAQSLFWDNLETQLEKENIFFQQPAEINLILNTDGKIVKVGRIEGKTNHKLKLKSIIQNMPNWNSSNENSDKVFYKVKLSYQE